MPSGFRYFIIQKWAATPGILRAISREDTVLLSVKWVDESIAVGAIRGTNEEANPGYVTDQNNSDPRSYIFENEAIDRARTHAGLGGILEGFHLHGMGLTTKNRTNLVDLAQAHGAVCRVGFVPLPDLISSF